jgi:outer membrane usher protein FimD/PapC
VGGYDLQWSTAIDGSDRIGNTVGVGYTGNRYTSELRHRVQSGIDENSRRNVTTAKLNSSLVFAGKSIALSRTVTDSFAIIDKHLVHAGYALPQAGKERSLELIGWVKL